MEKVSTRRLPSSTEGVIGMKSVLRGSFRCAILFIVTCTFGAVAWALVGGSISGTVMDQSGGVIPKATVTVKNTAQGTELKTTTDNQGSYSFPNLAVGRYDLTIEANGFKTQ